MNPNLQKYLDESPVLRAAAEADMREQMAARRKSDAEAALVIRQAIEQAPPAKRVKALEAYSASSLYGVHLERPPLIIQNIIPAGLSVLAGAPKRGKSWLALAMGISVSTGTSFLGMGTRQGDVLYLDLESRQFRVQDRLGQLLPGNFPERLYISHDAERIDVGLLDQLEGWLGEHPQASLIVVDTLARVKGGGRRGENAYESDSRIFGELQRFAQRHKLAVLVVHHLRKSNGHGEDSDPVERISGSMGLSGVADALLLLDGKRGESESALSIVSRDFESAQYVLRFQGGAWGLQSTDAEAWREEQAYVRSGVVRGVLALMASLNPPEWKGTASQLLEALQSATGEPLGVYDAKQLGRELEQVTRMIYERDGVTIRSKRTGKARELFIAKSLSDEF